MNNHASAITALSKKIEELSKPIDMIIFCPARGCGKQHIDKVEPCRMCKGTGDRGISDEDGFTDCHSCGGTGQWDNPPHKSHTCHYCGRVFRLADVPTNGVTAIKTKGKDDTWQNVS